WPRASYKMSAWDTTTPRQVEVMMGACMMLRRQALDQVGVLDEQYFMYTEEVDLCYRLSAGQWEVWYVPSARVTHYGGASSRQAAQEMFVQLYRSKVQFYRKTGGERLARRFKWMLRLAYWPRLAGARMLAPVSQASAGQAARYSRLLHELAGM
ncbi:MAG: glycosyltransferase, partial [Chloroflexota bacterium]